ncbi:MAG: DUF1294 domain-containing protein [Erysipelotrichia bacterium]|nr:DUF1294 domain-containing protein [Erysipelotrichia bacterium]
MTLLDEGLLIYAAVINCICFMLFGLDKYYAIHRHWRIRERTLILCAALGGSVGALAGMKVFHHKTLHGRFSIGVPMILLVQLAAVIWLKVRNVI